MGFVVRNATVDDFDAFYTRCYSLCQDDDVLRAIMQREWQLLTGHPAVITLAIEDDCLPVGRRMIGCGQVAFVHDWFVHLRARNGVDPWLKKQIVELRNAGKTPLLSLEEVAEHNQYKGLNAFITRWDCAYYLLSPEETTRVQTQMYWCILECSRGYNYKNIFIETVGNTARERVQTAGFKWWNFYGKYYSDNKHAEERVSRSTVLGITREEASAQVGTALTHLFSYEHPRMLLEPEEQRVGVCLVNELSNAEIADVLGISIGTVKNRLAAIYQRYQSAFPGVLPLVGGEGRRKEECKRIVSYYLREHAEELCPYGTSLLYRPIDPLR